ncbi:patatin-like phospholipase family protein [Gordonia polyisoprenivorans VH2]|uniref:Patatin-like phospholipase family protein n=1 Tax=Gordonia polyisoprenivorans (strain DSM 44266 / VH2) TaxID=1112204 RepID=H6MSI9_GORPV|nr:patatin-like phospholipase family protein [Gordonia polyisoprenivorans]AFA72566.1 patatin-like phospholipase family protein [Gordonia polyisoprenivorans VH2]
MATAIVLGGGGLVGIGWMTGVLAALEEAGALRLGDAAAVIGTSAGSAVGTAILQSGSAADQFDIMVRASRRNDELTPEGDVASALEAFFEVASSGAPRAERARRFVELSHTHAGTEPGRRRAAVRGRYTSEIWPENLQITALREDGELTVFTAEERAVPDGARSVAGVDLTDAVTASCAVPGIWPTVTIGGAEYIDGGSFSPTNAHLAAGFDEVIVIAPMLDDPDTVTPQVATVLCAARVITPSQRSAAGFGTNPLDPDIRGVAAVLGYDDGVLALTSPEWSAAM